MRRNVLLLRFGLPAVLIEPSVKRSSSFKWLKKKIDGVLSFSVAIITYRVFRKWPYMILIFHYKPINNPNAFLSSMLEKV